MIRIQKLILLLIIITTSKICLGQTTDSLKNVMLEEIKSNLTKKYIKEYIYDYKGKELPKFELTLLNGKKLNSESLKGKPTLMNFWFSNCAPCITEMPLLNEIKSKFGNEVNFISITYENQNEVAIFLKQKEFNFTHVVDSEEYLNSFGFFGYPKTLILDNDLIIIQIEKNIPKDTAKEKQNKAEFKKRIINKLTELKKR